MANIKVHLLNFHSIFSHIEIVLENTSTEPHTYYGINRWETPENQWNQKPKAYIDMASSTYSFEINANPIAIVKNWNKYWNETDHEASILGKNCAVAAQWFLTEFAGVPNPNLSNVSANHLIFGIVWPSFIPCPITLPGRVMSNAKFHLEVRNHPEKASQYSELFLYTSIALAALAFTASVFALAVAATILTGGIGALVIAGCVVVGLASSYGFFNASNTLSARNIASGLKKTDEPQAFGKDDLDGLCSMSAF